MTSRHMVAIALAAAFAAGCGKEEGKEEAPAPSQPADSPPPPAKDEAPPPPRDEEPPAKAGGVATDGEADLTFSGVIETRVTGNTVTCGYTQLGNSPPAGGSWQIRTDDFNFQIVATTDAELDEPTVILNQTKPERKSFAWYQKAGTVKAAKDRTVAEIDADLKAVVGSDEVHVKGTMKCPPLAR